MFMTLTWCFKAFQIGVISSAPLHSPPPDKIILEFFDDSEREMERLGQFEGFQSLSNPN